jgi:tetratricopeptide (TPR) repeat protein
MLQDPAAAREPIERAHGLAVQHEAPILRARALDALALLRGSELRFDEARQHAEQALRMVRERGGERLHAAVLLTAGWIELATGALEQASRYYAQARDAYEFIGDRSGLAFATLQQGLAAEEDESLEQAETLYEQAAQLGRVLGHDHIRGWALCRLALVAYRRGDLDRGRQWVDAGGALLQSTTGLDAVMHHLARATIAAAEGRTPAAERELAIAETAQASAPEVRGESTLFELHRALLRVAHGRSGQPDTTCPTPDPAGPSPSEVLRTTAEMDPRHLSWLSRVTVGLLQSALQGTGPTAQNEQAPPEAPGDPPPRARALTLGPDGRWFELDGRRVDLHRHPVMRRVLAALVEQRKTTPQQRLSVDDLLQAGWPGEHMDPASGARRVYVTISRLRKLGLGDVLEHYDEGYALAPDLEVRAQGTTERGG